MLEGLHHGRLTITLSSGRIISAGQVSKDHPDVQVTVHSSRAFRRIAIGGHMAVAETYMDGDWSCNDLTGLFEIFLINTGALNNLYEKGRLVLWIDRLRHLFNRNSKRGSRKNIAHHYDLGNNFYAAWLDPSMTYSSAYQFKSGEPLERAQKRKYQRVLELAETQKGHSLLEIGCGWGGLAREAASAGVKVHGITLSEQQLDYVNKNASGDGFSNNLSFELCDYRDVDGTYDHIISIEMIEAVGHENWARYFDVIKKRLKPGGVAVLQAITIDDDRYEEYRDGVDFIQRYIFPGGMLPSTSALRESIRNSGLELVECEYFGEDYCNTLRQWHTAFEHQWSRIETMGYDERFRRMWRFYLTYCEAGFKAKSIDVGFFKIRRAE